ncbi:MAG: hypothetical protein U5M51_04705 [Emticicia sp.]|nr:hypothetical protein [Emticicia sp.]
MKFQLEIEIAENKRDFVEEFFKTISFVKKVKIVAQNEITNSAILDSIEAYEKGKTKPTPVSLSELKSMIDA